MSRNSCHCVKHCPALVQLTHNNEVFLGQKADFSTFTQPFLGWWFVDANNKWVPAVNLKIKDGAKVAVHLGGTGGGLTRLGQLLKSFGEYDHVLGIRYNTLKPIQQVTGKFVADQLQQLLKLCCVKVDLFAYSLGPVVVRWALEVYELGRFEQIEHTVLLGGPQQGIVTQDIFEGGILSDGGLAAAINNAVEASTDVDSLGLGTAFSPVVTAVTAASNNVALPATEINVVSTAGASSSGIVLVTSTDGVQIVRYTGITATSFTGTTGGTGSLATGGNVSIPTFRDAVRQIMSAQFPQVQGNAQLDSKLPGPATRGEAIKELNNHQVECKTFCRLKYYTVDGFNFELFDVSLLNAVYALGADGHPYSFIGQYIYDIVDPAVIAKLEAWDAVYTSLGALARFALLQLPVSNVEAVPFDGFIPSRNDILTEKSKFFRDHRQAAEYLVPFNHFSIASSTGGAAIPDAMKTSYAALVKSFDYRTCADNKKKHATQ